MFCILYALVGIPLMIVFTAHIGDLMADAFRWMYSRVCCRWCRVRRRDNELMEGLDRTKEFRISKFSKKFLKNVQKMFFETIYSCNLDSIFFYFSVKKVQLKLEFKNRNSS